MGKNNRKISGEAGEWETSAVYGELQESIRTSKYGRLIEILRKGALSEVAPEEKEELCKDLFALRNREIADILAKQNKYLDAGIFERMDFRNWNNREFANRMLSRHKKKFNWQDEKSCEEMLELACRLNNVRLVTWLVKKKKAVKKYPVLSGASEDMFLCLLKADQNLFSKEDKRQILLEAAFSENPVERLQSLETAGYDLYGKGEDGKTLADVMQERLNSTRFSQNRSGELRRGKSKAALKFLQRERQSDSGEKTVFRKRVRRVAIAACGIIVIGVGAYLIGYFGVNSTQSNAQQNEEESEAVTESVAQSEQESDAQSSEETVTETSATDSGEDALDSNLS